MSCGTFYSNNNHLSAVNLADADCHRHFSRQLVSGAVNHIEVTAAEPQTAEPSAGISRTLTASWVQPGRDFIYLMHQFILFPDLKDLNKAFIVCISPFTRLFVILKADEHFKSLLRRIRTCGCMMCVLLSSSCRVMSSGPPANNRTRVAGSHHQADRLLHGGQSGHQLQCEERRDGCAAHQGVQRGTSTSRHLAGAPETCGGRLKCEHRTCSLTSCCPLEGAVRLHMHHRVSVLSCRNTPFCLTWCWC